MVTEFYVESKRRKKKDTKNFRDKMIAFQVRVTVMEFEELSYVFMCDLSYHSKKPPETSAVP